MMGQTQALEELGRLRNRHVAKLLTFLGRETAPYLENAIKREFTLFAEDVETNIIRDGGTRQHSEHSENKP